MGRPPRPPAVIESERTRLIDVAERLVCDEGPDALTMRRLASEARNGVGLVYRLFEDRDEIVYEVLARQLPRFAAISEGMDARIGHGDIADNLVWMATEMIAIPAARLAIEQHANPRFIDMVANDLVGRGISPTQVVGRYLAAEQAGGRVRADLDPTPMSQVLAALLRDHALTGHMRVDAKARLDSMVRALADALTAAA
jgi:AcrR family transcriptional regulator